MGGGPVLRSVAKLFSSSAPARFTPPRWTPELPNAGSALSSSTSGCFPSASCFSQIGVDGLAVLSQHECSEGYMEEQDDGWILAGGGQIGGNTVGVGSTLANPPTRREIQNATLELESALCSGMFVAAESGALRLAEIPHCTNKDAVPGQGRTAESALSAEPSRHWSGASVSFENDGQIHRLNEAMASAGYMDRFRLLITTPSVQGVIMALAEDKAVWDAVQKNDAVKIFLSQFQESRNIPDAPPEKQIQIISRFSMGGKLGLKIFCDGESEDLCESALGGSSLFSKLFDEAKNSFSKFAEVLIDFIKNMISYVEKEFVTEDNAAVDITIKACFALAVMVVSIILVKRVASI